MGGEDAIVRVTTRESSETAGSGRSRTPRAGGGGDRDRDDRGEPRGRRRGRRGGQQRRDREDSASRNDPPRPQDQPQAARDDRGPRSDRDDSAQREEPRGERDDPPQERGERDDRGGERSRGGRGRGRDGGRGDGGRGVRPDRREPRDPSTIRAIAPEDEIRVPGTPPNLPAAVKDNPQDEIDLFGSTLRDLLVILGLSETSITARDPETPGDGVGLISQVFDVYGETDEISDELAVLIGRRGETLNALQYLLNVLVSKHSDGDLIFSVDVEGYRRRRERTLVDMAHEIAAEVRATGDVITLEPMPAAERRIIHLTLESEDGVTTESVGRGNDRQVEVLSD